MNPVMFHAVIAVFALLLIGCGGSSDGSPPSPLVIEQPPAGGSRWATIGLDLDGDGGIDRMTRFGYQADGLRVSAEVIGAAAGVMQGTPQEVTRWQHDADGRVTSMTRGEPVQGTEVTTTYGYGPDGRLASATRVPLPAAASAETTFTWDGDRLVGEVTTDGASTTASTVNYGDDGWVMRIERRQGTADEPDLEHYSWRPDGQLASASYRLAVGNLILYALSHDEGDRLVRMLKTDDGIDERASRFHYDARGRLLRIDTDLAPEGLDEVDESLHIVWEDGPCQPVFLPQLPPAFDRHQTVLASASNASPGCAP